VTFCIFQSTITLWLLRMLGDSPNSKCQKRHSR